MQVKYKEGIEVLVPARIVLVDMDEDGIYYGVESPFWTGITYGRESNIVKINDQHVNGIVSEDMLEEAVRKARIEKRSAGKNCAGAKVEKRETTKSEPVTKSGKPRKKPGPKPKAAAKPEKTEAPKESLKGTNAAKSSSTSSKLQGFKPMKPTSGVKKDGTPRKKPGPKKKPEPLPDIPEDIPEPWEDQADINEAIHKFAEDIYKD